MTKLEKKLSQTFGWNIETTRKQIKEFVEQFKQNTKDGAKISNKILKVLIKDDQLENKWNEVKKLLLKYLDCIDLEYQILSFAEVGTTRSPLDNYFIKSTIFAYMHFNFLDSLDESEYLDSSDGLCFPHIYKKEKRVTLKLKNGNSVSKDIKIDDLQSIYNEFPMISTIKLKIKTGENTEIVEIPSSIYKKKNTEVLNKAKNHPHKEELIKIINSDGILVAFPWARKSPEVERKIIEKFFNVELLEVIETNLTDFVDPTEYDYGYEADKYLIEIFDAWIDEFDYKELRESIPRMARSLGFAIFKNKKILDIVCNLEKTKEGRLELNELLKSFSDVIKVLKKYETEDKYWDWFNEIERLKKQKGYSVLKCCDKIARETHSSPHSIRSRYYEMVKISREMKL